MKRLAIVLWTIIMVGCSQKHIEPLIPDPVGTWEGTISPYMDATRPATLYVAKRTFTLRIQVGNNKYHEFSGKWYLEEGTPKSKEESRYRFGVWEGYGVFFDGENNEDNASFTVHGVPTLFSITPDCNHMYSLGLPPESRDGIITLTKIQDS